jgi:hypothetical protein
MTKRVEWCNEYRMPHSCPADHIQNQRPDLYIIGETCRYCGCTEERPCIIPENMRDVVGSATCAWLIPCSVCNAPPCLERHYRDLVAFIEPAIRKAYGLEIAA